LNNNPCERYEFLFLDIEWNQRAGTTDIENREPIQIGIIGTDEKLENPKLFSKGICLMNSDDLTEETCKLTHATKSVVMNARMEKEIFEKVRQSFRVYHFVVVWTMDTYALFREGMRRSDIKLPRHKVLVLQDILGMIAMEKGKNIGFETALIKAGVSYESKYLHYAKHDVRYLHELFKKMYLNYEVLTCGEGSVVNQRSKIIHSLNCRYVQNRNIEIEENAKRLLFFGYKPCLCCGTEDEWRRFQWETVSKKIRRRKATTDLRMLSLTDENIQLICKKFGFKCSIVSDVVFLTTPVGFWRIYLGKDKVEKVFHGNYRLNKSEFCKKKKCNEGFHKQDVSMENFFDVIRYIYYHDKNMYKGKNKKSRVDILFEKIEQEKITRKLQDENRK